MSTSVGLAAGAAVRLPQPAISAPTGPTITPLLSDPESLLRGPLTHDLELPSVVAQRSAAAERQGYDAGYRDGSRVGQEEARQHAAGMLVRLKAAIDDIAGLRIGMLQRTERDVVRLAVAIAERIVRREVQANPRLLVTAARAAAKQLGDNGV